MSCLEKETSELKEAMEQQKGKNNVSGRCLHWGGMKGQREEAMGKLLSKLPKDTSVYTT